jgi:hypothetical protein
LTLTSSVVFDNGNEAAGTASSCGAPSDVDRSTPTLRSID